MATRVRPRGYTAVQYEDFQPKSEWKEEPAANILHVHLPDFQKEQTKITYVHSSRKINITGERQVADNKRSRFNLSFPVPQNCEVNRIQGRFQSGVLIITMPKSFITQPSPKEEIKVVKEDTIPPKAATTSFGKEVQKGRTPKITEKATTEPKAEKSLQDTASFSSQKQTDGKKVGAFGTREELEESRSRKGQDEATPKQVLTAETMKQKDEKSAAASAEMAGRKITGEEERRVTNQKPTEPVKEKMLFELEESSKKRKQYEESPVPKNLENEKEKSNGFGGADEGKPSQDTKISEKVKEVGNMAAAAAKKMKGAMELSEERQSLVNMGVAVLVIVALGAYIAYTYRSSGNVQD